MAEQKVIKDDHQIQSEESKRSGDCLGIAILVLVWVWILIVVFGRLITEALVTSLDTRSPNWRWAIFPLIQAGLLVVPLLPFSLLWKNTTYKRIYQTWLAAAGLSFVLTPMHLVPAWSFQPQTLILIVTALVYTLLIKQLLDTNSTRVSQNNSDNVSADIFSAKDRIYIGISLGLLFGIPWVLKGALGSPLDTVLSIITGSVIGYFAAVLITINYKTLIIENNLVSKWDYFLGGFSSGVILVLISAGVGFSFGLMQLLFLISIPALGWSAFFLTSQKHTHQILPVAVLIGTAFSVSLSMFDPDELALIINSMIGEVLWYAVIAAGQSLGIAILSSIVLLFFIRLSHSRGTTPPWLPTSAKIAAVGSFLLFWGGYLLFGQPGFFGEELFVVLTDQLYPKANETITDPIQIRTDVYNSLTSFATQSQSDIRDSLDRFGIKYRPYYLVNGLQVQGGPLLRIWLNTRPEVDRILDNPQLRPLKEKPPIASGTDSAPSAPQWNQKLIQADRVWDEYGVTGGGIIIGQSDSGVQGDHPELISSYRGRIEGNTYNWLDPWYQSPAPVDIGGHGTHTLGSILGMSTGIAPGAEWIACVNLARNLGNPAYYLDCMQFMLAPFPQGGDPFIDGIPERGANVLNNSWGCPPIEGCDNEVFQPAMQALREAGIFIVASAGNDGPACESLDNPIAIYDEVFSTGAIDRFGELAFFSSRGPVDNAITSSVKPDIVAPGVDVLSSYPNNTYSTASGTSMAGPHIVGVVALMWSANPELIGDIDLTEQILAETATQYSGTLPQCTGAGGTPSTAVGYGIVNAFEAVKRALELSPAR